MGDWVGQLRYDPVSPLVECGNKAVAYCARRDLLAEPVEDVQAIWDLAEPKRILKRQTPAGCWRASSQNREKAPAVNYDLVETFRQASRLIDMFLLTRESPAIQRAAEYVFSCQTDEGDIRGMLGNQYAPYYTGIITAMLIKAGYEDDPRVDRAIDWLLSVRQDDGGWVIGSPGCLGKYSWQELCDLTSQDVETRRDFDRAQPFSHGGTGMVIRAFAVHRRYRATREAETAARLLKSHFFREDNYSSYKSPENWVNFRYPFWWTDLISALDSVSLIGIPKEDGDVSRALGWLVANQEESGLWKQTYSRIHKAIESEKSREVQWWISLAICRVFRRYYGG